MNAIDKIDGLIVYSVPLNMISIKNHSLEGKGLSDSPYDQELKLSIKNHGVQRPLVLYKESNSLLIADGGHRYFAAIDAKLPFVPAVIFNSKNECYPTENLSW